MCAYTMRLACRFLATPTSGKKTTGIRSGMGAVTGRSRPSTPADSATASILLPSRCSRWGTTGTAVRSTRACLGTMPTFRSAATAGPGRDRLGNNYKRKGSSMTFKHKLSCRLALLRNVLLLGAVCAAAACDLRQLLGLLAPVASVSVAPATASVPVGQTVQFSATPRDSIGNALIARVVTWASSAPTVATVDINGTVTGVATGTSTITAMSEGKSGAALVEVPAPLSVPVASVTVSPATASVPAGQLVSLTATPKDSVGRALIGRLVTW